MHRIQLLPNSVAAKANSAPDASNAYNAWVVAQSAGIV